MKRIIIAGASAIVAALPAAGVFAATGTTVTDTVEVTINSACNITTTNASNTYSATMTNGQLKENLGSTEMSISCNDAGGWHVTAVGSGAATNKTLMKASSNGTNIATGVYSGDSNDPSSWAMRVTGADATGFTTFTAVPASATDVAKNTGASSESEIVTTYQVFISKQQQADTYTGQVTYTLAHPATQTPANNG